MLAVMVSGCRKTGSVEIPFDHSNPVVADNDSSEDTYTDELLMALHTSGRIHLRGMITTYSGWSEPGFPADFLAAHGTSARQELIAKAHRSGMANVPAPVAGSMRELKRPPSGRIEDTEAHGNGGTDLIIAEAGRATAEKPLVVVAGGPATTLAEAFLLEPDITNRVLLAWNGGNNWNGEGEPFRWATEIVLRHFRCVLFDRVTETAAPVVEKSDLHQLPDTELRQFMIDKELPHVSLPGRHDFDSPPAMPLMTREYAVRVQRCRWSGSTKDGKPIIKPDSRGNLWRVIQASQEAATAAWWAAFTNPVSWGNAPPPRPAPFGGQPCSIPARIQAAHFDEGGPGVAYFDTDRKNSSQARNHPMPVFRVLEHVDFVPVKNGYAVKANESEWLIYTVDVRSPGDFAVSVHISGAQAGSQLEVSIVGTDAHLSVELPMKLATDAWQKIALGELNIPGGKQTFRLSVPRGSLCLEWIEFTVIPTGSLESGI